MEKKPLFDKTHLLRAVAIAIVLFVAGFLLELHRPLMTRLSDAFMLSGAILVIIGMYSVIKNLSGSSAASVMRQKLKQKPAAATAAPAEETEAASEGGEQSGEGGEQPGEEAAPLAEAATGEAGAPEAAGKPAPGKAAPALTGKEESAELPVKKRRVHREALLIGVIEIVFSAIFAFAAFH
ncbi:MAG: hypothetical protein IJM69_07825 [Firmicutes bacterium]|nr:hypothetical protein [Bacillota bacterium]